MNYKNLYQSFKKGVNKKLITVCPLYKAFTI